MMRDLTQLKCYWRTALVTGEDNDGENLAVSPVNDEENKIDRNDMTDISEENDLNNKR